MVGGLFLFLLFGILWINAFITAKSSFIAMVSAVTYYFDSNSERDGEAEVVLGFKFAYFYHAGSLAFGSFIIALIQMIRILFHYVAEQAKKASGDNVAVRIVVGCAECCLKCIEKVVEYINKTAYAYMAVSGDNFCKSAWNGFLLNVKHTMKFSFANFLATMFILLGKVAIITLNVFTGHFFMKINGDLEEVYSTTFPLIVIGAFAFITSSIFLSLFDESVLAMLTCIAIDIDLHGTPKYGPPTFHNALDGFSGEPQDEDVNAKSNTVQEGGCEEKA